MAQVRLFASMRESAGRSHDELPGTTVAAVLDAAVERYGADFPPGSNSAGCGSTASR